jgi:hypothetical protein
VPIQGTRKCGVLTHDWRRGLFTFYPCRGESFEPYLPLPAFPNSQIQTAFCLLKFEFSPLFSVIVLLF